jgi:Glycosyl hydrolase family 1
VQGIATEAIKNRKADKRTKDLSIDSRLFEVFSQMRVHPGGFRYCTLRIIADAKSTRVAQQQYGTKIEADTGDVNGRDPHIAFMPWCLLKARLRMPVSRSIRAASTISTRIHDGARVRAFHAWSLLDNFEWTDGYSQRYGLTWMDFRDQSRIVKDSGRWYARVAATNRLEN